MFKMLRVCKRGFTLIEVLMIVTLLAILGVAALSSFVDTTGSFSFLEKYKEMTLSVRGVRSLAVTKGVEGADRVGVRISKVGDEILVDAFADMAAGTTPFELDSGDQRLPSLSFNLGDAYDIEVLPTPAKGLPLYVLYDVQGHGVTITSGGEILESKAVALKFSDIENGLERYLTIFQVSGLIEEYPTNPL